MASFVSSSLKTGRFIFTWPPASVWGCQPQHGLPRASQSLMTLMPLMRKLMLNICHSQTHDLMNSKGDHGMVPPITLIISGLSLGSPQCLTSLLMGWDEGQVWVLPIIQPLLRMFARSWRQILVMKIEWCWSRWDWTRMTGPSWFNVYLQWWLGWSATDHNPGLLAWHWVGLICPSKLMAPDSM